MKREEMIRLLAPPAPPCFESRTQWLSYLTAAAAEQRLEHEPGPLTFTREGVTVTDPDAGLKTAPPALNVPVLLFKGRMVTFNRQMSYCEECSTAYRARMVRENRCKPDHLRDLAPEPA